MGFLDSIKNLFGSAKQNVETMADKAHDMASDAIDQAKVAAAPLLEKVEEYAEIAKEKI